MIKIYIGLYVKYSCSCPSLIKPEFSRQIFENHSNSKFHENPSSGSGVCPYEQKYGRTNWEMTKLIVVLLNFSITPSNSTDTTPTCFGKIYHLQEIYVQLQMMLQVMKLSKYFFTRLFYLGTCTPWRWYIFAETCESSISTIYMYLILCICLVLIN